MKINYSLHLDVFDQAGVVGLLQVTFQVECATDASVGDHRFEDLGAVDLLPLPLALPQHVSGGGEFRGGERVAGKGRLPKKSEEVGKNSGKLFLKKIKLDKGYG